MKVLQAKKKKMTFKKGDELHIKPWNGRGLDLPPSRSPKTHTKGSLSLSDTVSSSLPGTSGHEALGGGMRTW